MAALVSPAFAQVSASLAGVITDQTGASVPAAKVTAKSLEQGAERMTETDSAGRFEFGALSVGTYEVRVSKAGFSQEVRTGVHLVVGQEATLDLQLRVGEASQEITVTEDAPIVNTTTADVQE